MAASGVLDRHPDLKVLISEGGATWIPAAADRMTEDAANAMLKAIEEPPPRGVLLSSAPSARPWPRASSITARCSSRWTRVIASSSSSMVPTGR